MLQTQRTTDYYTDLRTAGAVLCVIFSYTVHCTVVLYWVLGLASVGKRKKEGPIERASGR